MIIEFLHLGNSLRVAAVDTATAVEVVFQAPPATPTEALVSLARRKLAARLNHRRGLASEPRLL